MTATTTAAPATRKGPTTLGRLGHWAMNNGALVGLILLCLGLFIATPAFLTVPNLINIGIQASVVAILAFGMTFVIVTAGIDLSVGSVAALGAVVSAYSFASLNLPGILTLVIGLLVGAAAGAISGLSIAYGKLPAFIATLAMMSVARGLTLVISNGTPIPTSESVSFMGGSLGGFRGADPRHGGRRARVLVHPHPHGAGSLHVRHRRQRRGRPPLRPARQADPRHRLRPLRSVRGPRRNGASRATVLGRPPSRCWL